MTRRLFEGDTVEVAQRLLGCVLVHGETSGRILETEAYLAQGDAASHSAAGLTPRNASMFLPAGHAYVYLSYGIHRCFNVVTGAEGRGEAVLVRAIEPLSGVEWMIERRGRTKNLCDGPGKLCQALGIELVHDAVPLWTGGDLRVLPGEPVARVEATPRIGITKDADLALRFLAR